MSENICFIFGAGDFAGITYIPGKDDYVIAADGGYSYAKESGIIPDMVMGDFDSLGYIPNEKNIQIHPVMKDDTDMMIAVKYGMDKGYKKFIIYGGLGGRLAHTLGNIQCLAYLARNGGQGFLTDKNQTLTVISDSIVFPESYSGMISVFAHDDKAEGVTEKGLLYKLDDFTMKNHVPRGVSNEFTGKEAVISVKSGLLTIVWEENFGKELPMITNKMTN